MVSPRPRHRSGSTRSRRGPTTEPGRPIVTKSAVGPRGASAIASAIVVGSVTVWQVAMAAAGLHWYEGLLKPIFSPPPWLALVTCLALAATLGWAFFRILCRPDYLPDRPGAIRLFLVALALDASWSWMFFAGRHPTVALAAAAALASLSPFVARRFALVDRRAGLLMMPWTIATAMAFLIDLSIALRNG